ncbi:MAG: FAD:protein FMN transferase [Bacteroidales bacterium]|nr:FAD:protein FMN transferase [Bacteroidales bacterium]
MQKTVLTLAIALAALTACTTKRIYYFQEGPVYGSTYHISYEYKMSKSLEKEIDGILERINISMSTYDPTSVLSRINNNDSTARVDRDLRRVIEVGHEVSERSGGAFDMTVAPLVNAWGFGFTAREKVTKEMIDSLLQFTGYRKIRIEGDRLIKEDPRIMIDPNAITPGYVSDVIAGLFDSLGIKNYLVEIGGELRCLGKNKEGTSWRVGVDKPLENALTREIQQVFHLSHTAVATSGNYRHFYEENGVKYAHTINPKTGYPAMSNLLSATIFTDECIYADAYATVCMVLGFEKAREFCSGIPDVQAYFIYSDSDGSVKTWQTPGVQAMIQD